MNKPARKEIFNKIRYLLISSYSHQPIFGRKTRLIIQVFQSVAEKSREERSR